MIKIGKDVSIFWMSQRMILLWLSIATWSLVIKENVTVTGMQGWPYDDKAWLKKNNATGKAHREGRAIDVRNMVEKASFLKMLDRHEWPYLVEKDHIHIQTDGKCR